MEAREVTPVEEEVDESAIGTTLKAVEKKRWNGLAKEEVLLPLIEILIVR